MMFKNAALFLNDNKGKLCSYRGLWSFQL